MTSTGWTISSFRTLSDLLLIREGGLDRGIENIREHHRGFGFVPGGKRAERELWVENVGADDFGDTLGVVTAVWYFGDSGQVSRGEPARADDDGLRTCRAGISHRPPSLRKLRVSTRVVLAAPANELVSLFTAVALGYLDHAVRAIGRHLVGQEVVLQACDQGVRDLGQVGQRSVRRIPLQHGDDLDRPPPLCQLCAGPRWGSPAPGCLRGRRPFPSARRCPSDCRLR